MEIWDLYDRNDNKAGRTWERHPGNVNGIPDGLYHMVSDILVKVSTQGKGYISLT